MRDNRLSRHMFRARGKALQIAGRQRTVVTGVLLALFAVGCGPATVPSTAPTVTAGPTATAAAIATTIATVAPTLGAPYENVFSGVGNYTGLDALPFVAGRKYRVGWVYGDPGGCTFIAGFQATGDATAVQFARSASDSADMTGSADLTWKPENGSDPRLVVVSRCLWTVTVHELR